MKKDYVIKQNDIRDCGVCSLLSIIKYYNGYIPIEKLRLETFTNKEGTTAYHIINTAKKYGFEAVGIKFEAINNPEIILPAIAHLRLTNGMEHYVVIYKIDSKFITIMDPAKGYQKLPINDFEKLWTKVLLMFSPMTKIIKLDKIHKLYDLFKEIIILEKKLVIKITLITIIISIISIITSYYYKFGLITINKNSPNQVYLLVIIFISLNIFKVSFNFLREKYKMYLELHLDLKTTIPFLKHIFLLPLNSIKSRTTGEITTRYNEIQNIKDLISEIFTTIFLDLLLSIVFLIILFLLNNQLFFILCLVLIIYSLIGLLVSPEIYRRILRNIEYETDFNTSLIEKIAGIDSIKNLNITAEEIDDIKQQKYKLLNDRFHFQKLIVLFQFWQNFIVEIGLCLVTSWGFILILNHQLTILDLLTFNTLLYYLFEPIKNLISLLPKYYYVKASFQKINDFLAIEEESLNLTKDNFSQGDIDFQKINYSYNEYLPVFKDYTAHIKEKEHIMLEGPNGSGKSTLCKLLIRYSDKYQGHIKIGGIDIKDYDIYTIRNQINYVSQDEKLFSKTIKDNILMYQQPNLAEINKIIQLCCLQSTIESKPLRLQTFIQADGENISGGERQKIILARALLRDFSILILDEVLSEVAEETERQIIQNLRNNFRDKTIIYVTHKPYQKLFDRVIQVN